MNGGVCRLVGVARNVSDLASSIAFYCDVLGFSVINEARPGDPAWCEWAGHIGTGAEMVALRLGKQILVLVAFDPPGRSYPAGSHSCDLWFQHLAIVVADMNAAYAQLRRHGVTPISDGGPQRLPPSTGSVTAFKFRDPDGHPLELIHFPPETGDPYWHQASGLFLGVDHSAIAVAEVERSIGFYTRLPGLEVGARSLNSGSEQARLDALPDDVRVNVVALQSPAFKLPHVELLGYERPAGRPAPADGRARDLVADRLIFEVDDLACTVRALKAASFPPVLPGGASFEEDPQRALLRDPDGHRLVLVRRDVPGQVS